MGSLSDKLKALGVQTGAENFTVNRRGPPVEQIVPGEIVSNRSGECFLVSNVFPTGAMHGEVLLSLTQSLAMLETWSKQPGLAQADPESFVFLDTETTGLAGGVGTLLFLVGLGRFQSDGFHLHQFFLRDPSEEAAMLVAIEQLLSGTDHLVTYNGKSFDLPLLHSRYISNGWQEPWQPAAHLDLLHLARRLWRERLPSRTLGEVEDHILGVKRSEQEVPGWLVPQLYVDYLRSGDAAPLEGVFYHNLMDILSLAALMDRAAGILQSAVEGQHTDAHELLAVARMCEDLGQSRRAVALYEQCLNAEPSSTLYRPALHRLSMLYKRSGNLEDALRLWEEAAEAKELYSFEELAKYYEHSAGRLEIAEKWTLRALEILPSSSLSTFEKRQRTADFEHRSQRLRRKIARRG